MTDTVIGLDYSGFDSGGWMSLLELVLIINFPIFLGWFFKQLKIFKDPEISAIRKFIIKVTVPFIIFRNLYHADIKDVSQLIPSSTAFFLMSLMFAAAVYFTRKRISDDAAIANSFCIATFMGNYGYLGWGVLYYFYGDPGFTRAVFFTVFFWPVFLLLGFILSVLLSGSKLNRNSAKLILHALKENALTPIIMVAVALFMNYSRIPLPQWLSKSVDSFASITIPAILFTVGVSFSFIIKRSYVKAIISGTVLRIILGMVFGTLSYLMVSLMFNVDDITKKVILLESVMPSAAISPFFSDFIHSEKEVISGIITFSTLASLITLPLWYSIIEKWSAF